ncbi:MAG: endonuclease [Cryomorphaceae bacterium]|nr:endonuclease [Cryomorphaceae bacterium]
MKTEITCAFYNVENLFDTFNEPGKVDEDYTPEGDLRWDQFRYQKKLDRIADVIFGMAKSTQLPAVIGLCEVENRGVLEDLTSHPALKHAGYKIVHEESRDVRGIDVALLYLPESFTYLQHEQINFEVLTHSEFHARDILHVVGELPDGAEMNVFVNHWPSRRAGKHDTEFKRVAAGTALRLAINKVQENNEEALILVMGDFNDEPHDKSIRSALHAQESATNDKALVNLGWPILKDDSGTSEHDGDWFMFDQFMVSGNMLRRGKWLVRNGEMLMYKDDDVIFKGSHRHEVKPNRTYVGDNYKGGYSDHLAIYLHLVSHPPR